MTMDCQWLETKLEAFFTGELTVEEERRARGHIDACSYCRQEIQALHAIDPLIQNYFQYELRRALKRPSAARTGWPRRALLGLASTALAGLFLVVMLRSPQVNTVRAPESAQPQIAPASVETTTPSIKAEVTPPAERAKPSLGGSKPEATLEQGPREGRTVPTPGSVPDGNAPDFLVTDPAGYSLSLDDYRGHVLLIGVWSGNQPKAAASLERLYRTFSSNTNLRLIGVSYERQAKLANTTFPVVYNQGSRLLDAKPGEFVLLDESGTVRLRGSLTGDLRNLQTLLKKK